jgi:hypothetical protein
MGRCRPSAQGSPARKPPVTLDAQRPPLSEEDGGSRRSGLPGRAVEARQRQPRARTLLAPTRCPGRGCGNKTPPRARPAQRGKRIPGAAAAGHPGRRCPKELRQHAPSEEVSIRDRLSDTAPHRPPPDRRRIDRRNVATWQHPAPTHDHAPPPRDLRGRWRCGDYPERHGVETSSCRAAAPPSSMRVVSIRRAAAGCRPDDAWRHGRRRVERYFTRHPMAELAPTARNPLSNSPAPAPAVTHPFPSLTSSIQQRTCSTGLKWRAAARRTRW